KAVNRKTAIGRFSGFGFGYGGERLLEKRSKKYFPVYVDLSDKKVVVVGAGTIAKRRIRTLLDFTGALTVIAPEVNPELRSLESEGRLRILRKNYERDDLRGAALVIAATNDHRLNQEIYEVCQEWKIPVNVCNDKSKCDFYFPVLACDESIVVGVSSGGRDSAGSRRVADQIQRMLDERSKTRRDARESAQTDASLYKQQKGEGEQGAKQYPEADNPVKDTPDESSGVSDVSDRSGRVCQGED
ncbi:MAG: bifunctional precorrin-2 dehydrogenase/sirohydrochlorin ferrochelatase, partial [Lachnospiraceae bacterium]|nr:bifunctional precorrin-2 dehydrogenase/sirohydrochlorin ferrochelatase [Lachnospiraceae bacterium]